MAARVQPGRDPLDLLAGQAEQVEQSSDFTGSFGEPIPEQQPEGITNAQAFAGALAAGREAFCFFTKLDSPRRVMTDDRVGQLAALADPVLKKHNIELGKYLGDFGPEIALAVGVFSLVTELRGAVAAEIAERKAAEKKTDQVAQDPQPAAGAADGAAQFAPGQPFAE